MSFWAVQTAIYDALSGDTTLASLVVGVYDNVTQPSDGGDGANYPYIVVGESTSNPWDTDTETGFDVVFTIHSWSRYRGMKECKQIQTEVYNILHRGIFSVTGYTLVTCEMLSADVVLDPDGLTRHGTQTFRLLLDAN